MKQEAPQSAPAAPKKLPLRRLAREWAIQRLYGLDLGQEDPASPDVWQQVREFCGFDLSDREFTKIVKQAEVMVEGVLKFQPEIDALLLEYARNWSLRRMAAVDRNILRLAVFELRFAEPPVPVPVAINEAIEITHQFSDEQAGRFVNGILDRIAREQEPAATPSAKDEPAS